MIKNAYRALILDMDGTLINSEEMVLRSLIMTMQEFGITLTNEKLRWSIGCNSAKLMEMYGLGDRGPAACRRWTDIMADMLDQVPLFDGMEEVLAAPIRRGVVTSQTHEEIDANFARLGIADRIEVAVGADDTPYQKPHPGPLLHCLERMGLAKEDALFVGDTQFDLGCARDAGVDFGLALWGAEGVRGFEDAVLLLRHPGEILGYIDVIR